MLFPPIQFQEIIPEHPEMSVIATVMVKWSWRRENGGEEENKQDEMGKSEKSPGPFSHLCRQNRTTTSLKSKAPNEKREIVSWTEWGEERKQPTEDIGWRGQKKSKAIDDDGWRGS